MFRPKESDCREKARENRYSFTLKVFSDFFQFVMVKSHTMLFHMSVKYTETGKHREKERKREKRPKVDSLFLQLPWCMLAKLLVLRISLLSISLSLSLCNSCSSNVSCDLRDLVERAEKEKYTVTREVKGRRRERWRKRERERGCVW